MTEIVLSKQHDNLLILYIFVCFRATIIQHQSSKVEHANVGSVALPAVLRAGGGGQSQFTTGSMQRAQFTQVSNQAHNAHVAGRAVSVLCMNGLY